MRQIRPFLLALAVSLPALVAGPVRPELLLKFNHMRGRVAEAWKAVDAHRPDEARGILAVCLKEMPEHPVAHFLLAKMDYEAKDYARALAHMEEAERGLGILDGAYKDERALLEARNDQEASEIQTSMNSIQGGKEGYTGCTTPIFSDRLNRFYNLGASKNWNEDAGEPFQVPAAYHLLHANCLGLLGRDAQAIAHYRLAVSGDPALATAWHNLIFLLVKNEDSPGALETLRQADVAKVAVDPALRKVVETHGTLASRNRS